MSNSRRQNRVKAVLPVRVTGSDISGDLFSELVHTLDVTETGVRLGAVRKLFAVGTLLTLQYRQHKAEFRVVWIKTLARTKELQVGLEAVGQKDLWGLGSEIKVKMTAANSPARPEAQGCPA